MVQRTIYVSPDHWRQLRVLAMVAGTTASALVGDMIREYVETHDLPRAEVSPLRETPLSVHTVLSRVSRGKG